MLLDLFPPGPPPPPPPGAPRALNFDLNRSSAPLPPSLPAEEQDEDDEEEPDEDPLPAFEPALPPPPFLG